MNSNYLIALDSRKVCPLMQEIKLKNLSRYKDRVIRALDHDLYWVEGHDKSYNPYTGEWK